MRFSIAAILAVASSIGGSICYALTFCLSLLSGVGAAILISVISVGISIVVVTLTFAVTKMIKESQAAT